MFSPLSGDKDAAVAPAESPAPLVSRVDHVYARVADPRAVFATLTERLGLPRSYGFARVPILDGGAVSIGDLVFLEVLRYAPGRKVTPPSRPGLNGLALESGLPLREAASELSARGFAHTPPYTYTGDPRSFSFDEPLERAGLRRGTGPLWSMVVVGGLLGERRLARLRRLLPKRGDSRLARLDGAIAGRAMSSERFGPAAVARSIGPHATVWLHEFHAANMQIARTVGREQLRACGGGPLGIERVSEVVLSSKAPSREGELWQRLLDPCAQAPGGGWQLGEGPALRLVEGECDGFEALVCEVSSLDAAAAFLERERMLGEALDGEVRIGREPLQGLDIRLRKSARRAQRAPDPHPAQCGARLRRCVP
jgi:hypothetical protein